MDSPVQDDPYQSLGLSQTATAAEIKSAYRKLALRCHPDKVTDEALKKQKADEFHRIQQAYEILSDDDKRGRYDARLRLAQLKAELLRREGGARGAATASYDARPSPSAGFASFRSGQFEVRKPKYADDFPPEPRSTTRKHSDSGSFTRRTTSHTAKVDEKRRSEKEDKARSERRRARDADIRDSRERKYHSSSETVNDRDQFEEERRRRDDVVKSREEAMRRADDEWRRYEATVAEGERRRAEDAARKAKTAFDGASPAAPMFEVPDYSKKFDEARRYQESANYTSARPRPTRTVSKDNYVDAEVRRSRTRPTESCRRSPEAVSPTTLNRAATTGHRDILREMVNEGSRMPERSYSNNVGADVHDRAPPPPALNRYATMPTVHLSKGTPRRESKSSRLRPELKIPDSGYSSPGTATPDQAVPPTSKISTYRYTPSVADTDYMTASPDTYAPPYATLETRLPKGEKDRSERRRGREGSTDLPRPPIGPGRSYSRDDVPRRPSHVTRDSERERERDRDRDRDRDRGERRRERDGDRRARDKEAYYGEVASEYTAKNGIKMKKYMPEEVNVAKAYTRDDVRVRSDAYMRSGREKGYDARDREYARPSMSRSNTIGVL